MTIINANHYLEQLLAPAVLERIARLCKFCLRQRAITPAMLVPALLRAMGGDQVNDIAGLHRHFNALQLVNAHQVSYKPFHNQLHWFTPFSPRGRRAGDEGAGNWVNGNKRGRPMPPSLFADVLYVIETPSTRHQISTCEPNSMTRLGGISN